MDGGAVPADFLETEGGELCLPHAAAAEAVEGDFEKGRESVERVAAVSGG